MMNQFLLVGLAAASAYNVTEAELSYLKDLWPDSPFDGKHNKDLFLGENDDSKKAVYLSEDDYSKMVVDSSGKFVSDKPVFLSFIEATG